MVLGFDEHQIVWYALDPNRWSWSWYLGIGAFVSEFPSVRPFRNRIDIILIGLTVIVFISFSIVAMLIASGGMIGPGYGNMLDDGYTPEQIESMRPR
ncbi:MAG TPA: hypothetical protein PK765_04710 [bacterium]|nr:hypothetical protein [bacterium]